MCDQDHYDDDLKELNERAALSRRQFAALGLGAAGAFVLQRNVNAVAVTETDVKIKTADGTCDAYFVHPEQGKHAAVLIWPDIFGLREAFKGMATRLAQAGYAVLVVNPFYRSKRAPTSLPGADFKDPAVREALMALRGSLNADTAPVDAKAFLGFLDKQKATDTRRKAGTMGYCMGGPLVMRTAAALPDRIGAGASYHGGGLATDKPDSPHLLIPSMKASFLIAVAANDDEKDPAAKDTLRAAFDKAKLPAEIEVYAGTKHGWCPTDSPVYDHDQAEKAWERMMALFAKALA